MTRAALTGALAMALLLAPPAGAELLDWQVQEREDAPAPVRALRNVRDGFVTFGDAYMEANTAFFGVFCLAASQLSIGFADLVGVVDDNPVTQHVTKGFISKNLAKTAYLWHLAGAESLLGGHGMDVERWAAEDVASLNPLLDEQDRTAVGGPLPLGPLDFVGEAWFHTAAYSPHSLLLDLGAVAAADVAFRPVAGFLRIAQLPETADAVENAGNGLVRRAVRAW